MPFEIIYVIRNRINVFDNKHCLSQLRKMRILFIGGISSLQFAKTLEDENIQSL